MVQMFFCVSSHTFKRAVKANYLLVGLCQWNTDTQVDGASHMLMYHPINDVSGLIQSMHDRINWPVTSRSTTTIRTSTILMMTLRQTPMSSRSSALAVWSVYHLQLCLHIRKHPSLKQSVLLSLAALRDHPVHRPWRPLWLQKLPELTFQMYDPGLV